MPITAYDFGSVRYPDETSTAEVSLDKVWGGYLETSSSYTSQWVYPWTAVIYRAGYPQYEIDDVHVVIGYNDVRGWYPIANNWTKDGKLQGKNLPRFDTWQEATLWLEMVGKLPSG